MKGDCDQQSSSESYMIALSAPVNLKQWASLEVLLARPAFEEFLAGDFDEELSLNSREPSLHEIGR